MDLQASWCEQDTIYVVFARSAPVDCRTRGPAARRLYPVKVVTEGPLYRVSSIVFTIPAKRVVGRLFGELVGQRVV